MQFVFQFGKKDRMTNTQIQIHIQCLCVYCHRNLLFVYFWPPEYILLANLLSFSATTFYNDYLDISWVLWFENCKFGMENEAQRQRGQRSGEAKKRQAMKNFYIFKFICMRFDLFAN